MKPLVLTGWLISEFTKSNFADLAIHFPFRFVWGKLPPADELADYLGPRTLDRGPGRHWSDFASGWEQSQNGNHHDFGLAEFCRRYETIELWFDTFPAAQLLLVWLLDYFRSYPGVVDRLKLRLLDRDLTGLLPGAFATLRPPDADVEESELETAQMVWQAYRSSTPEACFDLLRRDLSPLPLLRPVLRELLDELPSTSTGLGATETRMLELIARGYERTNTLFHNQALRRTRVFSAWEHGYLLDGLAHGPMPAVTGLDDEIRMLSRENLGARLHAYHRSRLSLTEFGKKVLRHQADFSRHNPVDRWWGGTHLASDRLWRHDPVLTRP